MTYDEWVKGVIGKLPVFEDKDAAIKAAIEANQKQCIHDIWKEPADRGGRFVVADPQAFEALYREKYERVLTAAAIGDIERGENIDEIEDD